MRETGSPEVPLSLAKALGGHLEMLLAVRGGGGRQRVGYNLAIEQKYAKHSFSLLLGVTSFHLPSTLVK